MKAVHRLQLLLISSFLLFANAGILLAETAMSDHQHSHGHDEYAASGLSLDHGEKWKTDAPLRHGMKNINEAVINVVPAYHHETLTKIESEKLSSNINTQVNYLIENCKLEPGADATLHVLIGDLLSAADKVSNDPLSEQGMPHLVKTMQLYQDYFEHPGLKSIH